jgi:hypothetical protein
MAKAKPTRNGRLEEAMATLLQNQASLVQNQAAFVGRMSEIDERLSKLERIMSERFARIEAILIEHSRILQTLPDAIREKIGFKPPERPSRAE